MMNTTPKTATEALRLVKTVERAEQIIKEGYSFTQDVDTKIVFVCKPGRLYAEYTIGEQLTGKNGCSCPDFQKFGDYCKHSVAWGIKQDEEAEMEALCAEYDARVAMEF